MFSKSASYANKHAAQEPAKIVLPEIFFDDVIEPSSMLLLEMFKCATCDEGIILEPHVTECNHMFCKQCMQHMLEGAGRCEWCDSCITRESTKDLKDVDAELYKLYDSINVRCPRGDTHKCSWTGKLSALVEHIYAFEAIGTGASTITSGNTFDNVKDLKCAIDDLKQRLDRTNQLLEQSQQSGDHARCAVHSNFNVDTFDHKSLKDADELIKYLGSNWKHIAPDRAHCHKLYQCMMNMGQGQMQKLKDNAVSHSEAQTTRTVLALGAGMSSWFVLSESVSIENLLLNFQREYISKTSVIKP